MGRPLSRLGLIAAAVALLAVTGCGSVPSASRTPASSPEATAPPTPTPLGPSSPGTHTVAPFPWPSGPPAVRPGEVDFALLVTGTPASGEELDLYFQAPQAGQNEFELCGPPRSCRSKPGQVYTWGARNLAAGASPYAFQKRLHGSSTTIQSGMVDAAQGAVVTAIVSS